MQLLFLPLLCNTSCIFLLRLLSSGYYLRVHLCIPPDIRYYREGCWFLKLGDCSSVFLILLGPQSPIHPWRNHHWLWWTFPFWAKGECIFLCMDQVGRKVSRFSPWGSGGVLPSNNIFLCIWLWICLPFIYFGVQYIGKNVAWFHHMFM